MNEMIFAAEAPPVQNWYDTVPLNDVAKRGLREIEKNFWQAAGDWSLVAASQFDEAEIHAGEHFQSWLSGCLGLTPSQATQIKAMAVQTQQDRKAYRMAEEGMTQTEIGEQLGMARQTVGDAIDRASRTMPDTSGNMRNSVPDCRVKLTIEEKDEILRLYEEGADVKDLMETYGVSKPTIYRAINARKEARRRKETSAITKAPLPTAPSSGNDVSSNGALVTPSVALFTEKGHDLQKLTAYHHKRFVQELKHCFAAIDNATRRLDKVHNAVLDDMQKSHRDMYLRWTVYEQLWSREMQLDLECIDFAETERRLDSKAKLLSKKVAHAFSDLHFDRSKITIAK